MSMLFYPPGSDFQSAILEDARILVHAQWGLPQGASGFGRDLDDAFQVTVHQRTGECIGMDGLHARESS